jgi:hypothetical protein
MILLLVPSGSHLLMVAWTIVFGWLVGWGMIYCGLCLGVIDSIAIYLWLNRVAKSPDDC